MRPVRVSESNRENFSLIVNDQPSSSDARIPGKETEATLHVNDVNR